MNEMKRQLNKKMGDTNGRAEAVMARVNNKKRQDHSKKRSNVPYYATFVAFIVLVVLFFIMNPLNWAQQNSTSTSQTEAPPVTQPDEESGFDELRKIFKNDGDVAYFVGEGNEYATFTEKTSWLNEEFVELVTDNGGAVTRQIYHITDEAIVLVYVDMIDEGYTKITIEKLEQLTPISTLLPWPIVNNATFENFTITNPGKLETPFRTFKSVVQVTSKENGYQTHMYYAAGYGLIGRVFEPIEATDEVDAFRVTSLLASVNTPPEGFYYSKTSE